MFIRTIIADCFTPQFLRFFVAACLAATVNFFARILLDPLLGYSLAVFVAYLIGMIVSFVLYQRQVFSASDRPLYAEMLFFSLINVAGLLQTVIFSLSIYHWVLPWLDWTWKSKEIAHIIGMAIPVFSSFIGHKYLTFQSKQL